MNREQILISLRELREQLPLDLIRSEYSDVVFEDVAEQLVDAQTRLRESISGAILIEPEVEEIKALERELTAAEYDDTDSQMSLTSSKLALKATEADLALFKYRLDVAERRLLFVESESDKNYVQALIDVKRSDYEEVEKDVVKMKEEIAEEEANVKRNKDKLDDVTKRLGAARKDRLSRINAEQKTKVEETKKNISYLKTKAGFLSLDIVEVLDNLISDYEAGSANEREVNFRVNQIRETLESNMLFNAYEKEEAAIVYEQLDRYDERIAELEAKIADNKYVMSEEDYQSKLTELKSTKRKMQNNLRAQDRRYHANLDKLESIKEELNDIRDKDEPRRQQLLEESRKIEERNRGIESRMDVRREQLSELNDEIAKLQSLHGNRDLDAEKEDKSELKSLKISRERMRYLDRLHSISLHDKLNTLLLGTGSRVEDLKSEETGVPAKLPELPTPPDSNLDGRLTPPKIAVNHRDLGPDPSTLKTPAIDPKYTPPLPLEPIPGKRPFPDDDPVRRPIKPMSEITRYYPPAPPLKKKKKKILLTAIAALAILLIGGAGGAAITKAGRDANPTTSITQKAEDYSVTESTLRRLYDLLNKCLAVDKDLYTVESYNEMIEKVYHIQALLNGNITEYTCRQEINELQKLYDNLVLRTVTHDDKGKSTPTKEKTESNEEQEEEEEQETENPVVNPSEPHENNPDIIYLAPGDSAGVEGGGTVDYDGVQRDANGNVIGNADVTQTEGGYTVVPTDQIPGVSEEEALNNVPTGNETTDLSDLTDAERDALYDAVTEDMKNGEFNIENGMFNWTGIDFNGVVPESGSEPVR